jgi:hypothetical protein
MPDFAIDTNDMVNRIAQMFLFGLVSECPSRTPFMRDAIGLHEPPVAHADWIALWPPPI